LEGGAPGLGLTGDGESQWLGFAGDGEALLIEGVVGGRPDGTELEVQALPREVVARGGLPCWSWSGVALVWVAVSEPREVTQG